ncbi:unnamed protein product [Schistosoma margrebowiei]|uniref:Uncharacterized protein n=1 Tax=Schistosoma margrebowiei TaxID=48269 RepID=A0A183LC68_9TREM|nr:unnamed protein product [Schistosoma margrebowiei]
MKTSTSEGKHCDPVFLCHTLRQMQMKKISESASGSVVLNRHKGQSKILKYNTENINQITLDEEALEQVEYFT